MKTVYCEDYDSLSVQAAARVITEIEKKNDLLLCAATGNSPVGLYGELVRRSEVDRELFEELRIVMLDEWVALPEGGPGSCRHYLRTRLLDPLGIPPERCIEFDSNAAQPAEECERVRSELTQRGPIDVCILGLGTNGHIGFNEPGSFLVPCCHPARLREESRQHGMVRSLETKPQFGMTLGMQEILASRRIILLVAGAGKSRATANLLSEQVTTMLPASFLWLHDNVDCLIDRTAPL
jgi:galactosamine-6-phosphate isomerase